MKRYVSAASSAKHLTQGNYISKVAQATESVKQDTTKLDSTIDDVICKLVDALSMLEELDLDYPFDKYNVDNPEEFGWFDDIADSDVDSYYGAYEKFCKAAEDYDAFTCDIESLKRHISKIVPLS